VTAAEELPYGLPMSVAVEGEHLVVSLRGEIDVGNAEVLPAALLAATSAFDTSVMIDIGEVTFLDSSGLRAILICEATLRREDISLKVRNPSEQARRVFEITGLRHLLV
jgi:anti-sigma B factor antagonist